MGRGARSRSWSSPPPTAGRGARRRGAPAPLAAASASAVLPGAGQHVAGERGKGAAYLAVTTLLAAAAAGAAGVALGGGTWELLAWLAHPAALTGLLAGNALLGLFRLVATIDAWRSARRAGGRVGALQAAGLGALVVLLVVAPHAGVAVAGVEAGRVLDALFAPPAAVAAPGPARSPTPAAAPQPGPDASAAAPEPQPEHDTSASSAAPPVADAAPRPPPGATADAHAPPTTLQPVPRPLLGGAQRLTVLLLGSDAGPERTGVRIDALVVVTVDVVTGDAALVSVPRNLGDVPLTGVFADRLGERFPGRIMDLYLAAASDPVLADSFDDAGTYAHVNAVEALLDLPVHHVAQVDLAGFVDVVDALGGVEVQVAEPIRVRLSPPREGEDWRSYDIPAGRRNLDGHEAHAFVRSRTGTDDYDRMRRQRCLLGSMVRQADTLRLLRSLPALADVVAERVRTDVGRDALPDLVRLAGRVELPRLRTLGITPPAYTDGLTAHGHPAPDLPLIRAAVRDLVHSDSTDPGGAVDLDATCG